MYNKTIKDKLLKERERILKAQVSSSMSTGYSKISQKLFHSIYERIKDFNLGKVYYAENLSNGNTRSNNGEYVEFLSNGKFYLYDFYIPSINFIIEFDGDYWHSEKIKGSIERDDIRENNIKLFRPELEIVHVKECDYKSNQSNVVDDLLFNITGLMTCKK